MKALQAHGFGEPEDVLGVCDRAVPIPGDGQVLVSVKATALNFPDVLMVRGAYQVKATLPFVPGVELCGEVIDVGDGVSGFAVGERVLGGAVLPDGGFAEMAIMDPRDMYRAPDPLTDAEAASFQYAYQTGWFGLHRRARLQPGETLLVHAAAGGVGSAAVQLGKAAGATVIGVVGGADKARVAHEQGADLVIDRHHDDFVAAVNDITGGRGADVVYDPVGGGAYAGSTKCIAFEGRIVVVGFAGGEIQSALLNHALVKNYSIIGLHWGLYRQHDRSAVQACHDELSRLAAEGAIQPLVSEMLPLEQVPSGLARLAGGTTVGRLVYVPSNVSSA